MGRGGGHWAAVLVYALQPQRRGDRLGEWWGVQGHKCYVSMPMGTPDVSNGVISLEEMSISHWGKYVWWV